MTSTMENSSILPVTKWLLATPGAKIPAKDFLSLPDLDQTLLRKQELLDFEQAKQRSKERLSQTPSYAKKLAAPYGEAFLNSYVAGQAARWSKIL